MLIDKCKFDEQMIILTSRGHSKHLSHKKLFANLEKTSKREGRLKMNIEGNIDP